MNKRYDCKINQNIQSTIKERNNFTNDNTKNNKY